MFDLQHIRKYKSIIDYLMQYLLLNNFRGIMLIDKTKKYARF